MQNEKTARGDLTTGVIWKKLVRFALPLLLSSLVQQLYNTVDLIFAGNMIDASASAAIGVSTMLVTCLVGFFGGMSVGSGVTIARRFGQRDYRRLGIAIHSTVALCIGGSAVLMALGELLTPIYIQLLRTPEELAQPAMSYLRIYFLSMPAIIFYNLCSGALRSLGDSRSTLVAQALGGMINVVMDYLLIKWLPNGVQAVAWATLLSQTISAAYVVYRLTRLEGSYALRLHRIALDGETFRETVKIGVPAGLQALTITLSNVMAQYHINALGRDAVAAFTAYFKVELLIYYPIVSLGQAVMTFVGQNWGAEQYDRVRRGTRTGLMLALGISVVTSALGLLLGRSLFRIFYRDEAAIALGLQIIQITFPFYFTYCFLQLLGDSLRGMGRSQIPMLIVMINLCLVRTLLLFIIVPRFESVRGVAVCYPITWVLTSLCMAVAYRRS